MTLNAMSICEGYFENNLWETCMRFIIFIYYYHSYEVSYEVENHCFILNWICSFFFLISMNFYIVVRINKVHIYSIGIYRFEKNNIICIQNVTLFLKKKIKYRIFSFKAEVIVTLRVLLKIMQFKNLIRNGILDLNR